MTVLGYFSEQLAAHHQHEHLGWQRRLGAERPRPLVHLHDVVAAGVVEGVAGVPEHLEVRPALVGRVLAPEQLLGEGVVDARQVGLDEAWVRLHQRQRVARQSAHVRQDVVLREPGERDDERVAEGRMREHRAQRPRVGGRAGRDAAGKPGHDAQHATSHRDARIEAGEHLVRDRRRLGQRGSGGEGRPRREHVRAEGRQRVRVLLNVLERGRPGDHAAGGRVVALHGRAAVGLSGHLFAVLDDERLLLERHDRGVLALGLDVHDRVDEGAHAVRDQNLLGRRAGREEHVQVGPQRGAQRGRRQRPDVLRGRLRAARREVRLSELEEDPVRLARLLLEVRDRRLDRARDELELHAPAWIGHGRRGGERRLGLLGLVHPPDQPQLEGADLRAAGDALHQRPLGARDAAERGRLGGGGDAARVDRAAHRRRVARGGQTRVDGRRQHQQLVTVARRDEVLREQAVVHPAGELGLAQPLVGVLEAADLLPRALHELLLAVAHDLGAEAGGGTAARIEVELLEPGEVGRARRVRHAHDARVPAPVGGWDDDRVVGERERALTFAEVDDLLKLRGDGRSG